MEEAQREEAAMNTFVVDFDQGDKSMLDRNPMQLSRPMRAS
jgi:sensor domain CHASE-containing protein